MGERGSASLSDFFIAHLREDAACDASIGVGGKLAIVEVRSVMVAVACLAMGDKRPAAFVDIAEVAPDVVVDLRYAGGDNFLGRPARGYGAAALPADEAGGARARRRAARRRGVRAGADGLRLLSAPARRRRFRRLGARCGRARDRSAAPPGGPAERAVPARLHRGAIGPQPRQHRRPDADPRRSAAARGRPRRADCRIDRQGRWRRTGASTWGRRSTASTSARTRRTAARRRRRGATACCCGR